MRIALDALGSDNCPDPEIQAAIQSAATFKDEILLVGPEDLLQPKLGSMNGSSAGVKVIDAPEAITMDDKGIKLALKAKRRNAKNSMAVGIDLIKNNEADAFITAGNTGGALATAYYRLGLIEGLERPGLTALFPVKGGHAVVLDIGANPDCKPEHLYQFAIMGSIYAQKVLAIQRPRVGLLSNGEETGKGNQLIRDTSPLLEASDLNFIGNIEGKELFGGQVDVAVMDGFTGNILLKSSEAVAKLLIDSLRDELMSSLRTKIGAALAKPAFSVIRKMLDPAETGAAPLLGVDGLVFIGHGRSDAYALVSAVRVARQAVAADLLNAIQGAIEEQLISLSEPGVS
ncbi:MAG: phosphate acyltransferase PlsX [Chloroflexota bacterium]|nr:MAG: phosphate acyltransferase PlsX [Chloroflexota bacterium]